MTFNSEEQKKKKPHLKVTLDASLTRFDSFDEVATKRTDDGSGFRTRDCARSYDTPSVKFQVRLKFNEKNREGFINIVTGGCVSIS